ncbi:MAG: hypothetical protein JWQ32_2960 [Marmoricola sp.]|nr:hypothetical protein [Marmoricola sp.]
MTPLSPARRDAEAFASAVESRASKVDGSRGDVADRYADLLTYVDVMREQEIPAPRADFVADLRSRLMSAADTLLVPTETKLAPVVPLHGTRASRNQRRISVAAAAFVVIGGTAGVAAAAESALPGSALYPIKRGIESAQVSLSGSDSGKGQDLLRQASTRLDEVDGLMSSGTSASQITSTLSAFQRSATDGANLLFVDYQRNGNPQDIANLRTMIGSQLNQLDQLAGQAPVGARPAFTSAHAVLTNLDQQAVVLCNTCGPGGAAAGFPVALSSAPALASLLDAPASRAQQEQVAAEQASHLADKAGQIAKGITSHLTPTKGTGGTSTSTSHGTGTGTPAPGSGVTAGLTNQVGGLTSGVTGLLSSIDKASGGTTAPLTATLDTTLGLLGLGGGTTGP